MRIYIFLIFVCVASTLARSKYKRETGDISFSDNAGISAGLNGAEGHFKKSIGLKPFLLNPFDKTSESKEIGLNIGGNLGLKPKLNLGEDGKSFGISLGGSGGLGVGILGSKEKKHSEKKHSKKHKQSKENSSSEKSSEESIIGEIWKEINNGISADVKGDAGLSFGTGGISANIDGDISAGANSKKERSSSSKEEDVIVIPIVDGKNSESYEISGETKTNKTNVKGVIITSSGNKETSDNSSDNKNKKHVDKNGSEKHRNEYSGKKEKNNSKHSEEGIVISHDKSRSNKEHANKNNNHHTRGESDVVISHEKHDSDHAKSKEHHGSVEENKSKNNEKTEESNQVGKSVTISHSGQSNEKHNSQNGSKGHQESSKENETKNSGITEGSKSTYTGGSITISHNSSGKTSSDHKEHNSKTGTEENINHENDHGKHVNVTIDGSHSHNKSKNSKGKIGITDGKDSSHGKNNRDSNNCNEILNNGKCGSNIKQTLQIVQTFIRSCHAIVHFLLKLNEAELRRVLCEILPHDNKLSCQLGCNILRVIRHG